MSPSVNFSSSNGDRTSLELDQYGQYKVVSSDVFHLPVNTTSSGTMTTTETPYDGEGAMKFTVAVVMVYGVAVIGVFFMSYYGRKKQETDETDRQAHSFLKNFDQVRYQLIKQKQVCSVTQYLRETSTEECSDNSSHNVDDATKDMFKYMALPIFVSQAASDSGVESEYVTPMSRAESCVEDFPASISPIVRASENKLEIVEEKSEEELDDNVFMTEEERQKYGVDFYVDVRESDIC